ncbi:Patatin [Desulfonatronospira thiodismutans ASO3-1]|uniref:Patatin n=1 Tax=Desulfonatronospira thiodismutans ASO3-1 TaxID=555779 RepID=D6SQ33_9BACT|nr:patatin-like phospholipase family protein [Desulfonatronospira thiodismutans]EFI34859.1 Patatin [Desulfonatronospira thiodismutans ASO3-1]
MKDTNNKQRNTTGCSRRDFLAAAGMAGAGLVAWPGFAAHAGEGKPEASRTGVGLALGAGGANGLAHIAVLEALDEIKVRPKIIAGSSIGAILGVLYASGISGREMREAALEIFDSQPSIWGGWLERITGSGLLDMLRPGLGEGGLLDPEGVLDFVREKIQVQDFEELQIPLKVVATDFWRREQVVFDSGEIIPAIEASMAVPGLFAPVRYQDRLLVDGAIVNPVPFDLVLDSCDISVAVDVSGKSSPDNKERPSYLDTIFATFEIMQESIMQQKLRIYSPDIYLRPEVVDVRLMQFNKIKRILKEAEPARERLKEELERLL